MGLQPGDYAIGVRAKIGNSWTEWQHGTLVVPNEVKLRLRLWGAGGGGGLQYPLSACCYFQSFFD